MIPDTDIKQNVSKNPDILHFLENKVLGHFLY